MKRKSLKGERSEGYPFIEMSVQNQTEKLYVFTFWQPKRHHTSIYSDLSLENITRYNTKILAVYFSCSYVWLHLKSKRTIFM